MRRPASVLSNPVVARPGTPSPRRAEQRGLDGVGAGNNDNYGDGGDDNYDWSRDAARERVKIEGGREDRRQLRRR
jgi:hypothetical protein